uniref:Integrase catalytic domain-containing protein n=1 Tax=Homalodisca liturata TaxID=320908 RepID=A0A1B6HNZ1_9HEMI
MELSVKNQLKCCQLCQCAKHTTVKSIGFLQPIIPKKLKDIISVDLIGELPVGRGGVKYIFVVLDLFSKFVKLYPVKRATSRVLLNKLINEYIPEVGEIGSVLSDHGSQFTSNLWYNTLRDLNIKTIHSSVWHPASNPVERANKEITKICRIYCHEKHTKWPLVLNFIEKCLNHSVHETTEEIPFELMFGRKDRNFLQDMVQFPKEKRMLADYPGKIRLVKDRLVSKGEKRKRKFDNKVKPIRFSIGDEVLVKTHYLSDKLDKKIKKFFLLYEGPYRVSQIKLENAYVVVNEDGGVIGTFNVTQLKKFYRNLV